MTEFDELLILDQPSPVLHGKLDHQLPTGKLFLWDSAHADAGFYRILARLGKKIVVQSGLRDEFMERTGLPAVALRDRDKDLHALVEDAARKATPPDPKPGPILFCPLNDTHSHMFHPILQHLDSWKVLLAEIRPRENAEGTLRGLGIEPLIGGPEVLDELRPSVVVTGNDWNLTMKKIVAKARKMRIPSVCLQEGCLDFDTQSRMAISDFPLIQGPIMPSFLRRPAYIPTGNPRFDPIRQRPLPPKPLVMINCNFTYGVHEDQREPWVRSVADACRKVGLEFFVSQHPRDKGVFPDLPVRPSGAGVVHEMLAESTIFVTRFSTVIYEAMIMGRRCLYYNPFGEKMRLFNEDRTHGLLKAWSAEELAPALQKAAEPMDAAEQERFDLFLDHHCGVRDGGAARRCAGALKFLATRANPLPKRGFLSLLGF